MNTIISDPARRRRPALTVGIVVTLFLLGTAPASAADEDETPGWQRVFSPTEDLFPRYVADPRRARFRIARMRATDTEIEDAGDNRYGLTVGGRYALFRFHPADEPDRGVEIAVEGGIFGEFDLDESQDNLGWDGLYGFHVAWAPRRGPVLRFGVLHQSSHLGDEYIEETGRERIDYTRQEALGAASWSVGNRWRMYGEAAWAWDLRNEDLQEPWRGQYGLEYESGVVLGQSWTAYAALDVSHFEENHWNANVTIQSGLRLTAERPGRSYRFGIEYYDGRSRMGEFAFDDESLISAGLWFDL